MCSCKMKVLCVVSLLLLLLASVSCAADEVSRDVVLSYVSRDLDLTTHLRYQVAMKRWVGVKFSP